MPRQRSPSRDKAKQMYLDSKGKMLLKDIASQLNVKDTQVRKWKSQDKWDELKGNVTNPKGNVTNKCKGTEKQIESELSPEEIELFNNEELTEKQRLFCFYYSKSFNATRAYQKAYECDYRTAMVNGPRSLGNTRIKAEIMRLKKERYARELLTQEDIFQKYLDIAMADVTDFVEFGFGQFEVCGETVSNNYIRFHDHAEVDGTIIGEVKQGKDGVSIKLADRMKALQWLSDHIGWATELQKAQINQIKAQTDKLKAETQEDEELEDDGFLNAIKNAEVGEWTDEEI